MPLLLNHRLTSSMNAIGAFEVICPYPFVTCLNINLCGWYPASPEQTSRAEGHGLNTSRGTDVWRVPCGQACPALLRNLSQMEGVGRLAWGGYHKDFDHRGEYTDTSPFCHGLSWRRGGCRNLHPGACIDAHLGYICRNRLCPMSRAANAAVFRQWVDNS